MDEKISFSIPYESVYLFDAETEHVIDADVEPVTAE